jgi:hypothetical protein
MKTGPRVGYDAVVLSALFVAVWATPALAYIDPGTGSAAYQIILTGFLAVGYALRRFWWRASGKLPRNAEEAASNTADLTSSAAPAAPSGVRNPEQSSDAPFGPHSH